MGGREAARRIVSQNELSDTEALEHIAGLLNGLEWDADTAAQIATIVRETGRDVAQSQGGDDTDPGYDPDEGEIVDYEEDPDEVLVALSGIVDDLSRTAIRVWNPATGQTEHRPPAKPVPVDHDVDVDGVPQVTCPRCKGHGGVFPADEGESCNLCDGHGEVYDHGGSVYSNDTDRNTYMY